jgi:hypothetical protein
MVTTGGRYIIYAGGLSTKVSGMCCVTILIVAIFEINQNQDIWARDLRYTSFGDGSLLSPPWSQDWEGCIHRRADKTLRM